jgi:hypothetical protein
VSAHEVPDLAYGDAPDSFDSPDGRTYSGPVTAATPGQADVYVTYDGDTHWLACFKDEPDSESGDVIHPISPGDSWDTLTAKVREHRAEHGCAAQEPHAVPEVQFAPCPVDGHDGSHMQWRSGQWTCGHVLANSLVLAGILPVPEPQPAPELAAARNASDLEVASIIAERNQLRMVLQWLADDGNLEARDRLAAIRPELTSAASGPAPELAAAMRESRLRAEVITEILAAFGPSGSGHTARVGMVQIAKWRTRAGLTS